jgi:hypothetical protein
VKLYDFGSILIIVIISAGVMIALIDTISDAAWPDDNPIEEIEEQLIEDITGLDIDLTPDTPE